SHEPLMLMPSNNPPSALFSRQTSACFLATSTAGLPDQNAHDFLPCANSSMIFWNASDERSLRRPSGGAVGAAAYAASVFCSAVTTLSQMSCAAAAPDGIARLVASAANRLLNSAYCGDFSVARGS